MSDDKASEPVWFTAADMRRLEESVTRQANLWAHACWAKYGFATYPDGTRWLGPRPISEGR